MNDKWETRRPGLLLQQQTPLLHPYCTTTTLRLTLECWYVQVWHIFVLHVALIVLGVRLEVPLQLVGPGVGCFVFVCVCGHNNKHEQHSQIVRRDGEFSSAFQQILCLSAKQARKSSSFAMHDTPNSANTNRRPQQTYTPNKHSATSTTLHKTLTCMPSRLPPVRCGSSGTSAQQRCPCPCCCH